ncbi:MAG: transketolase [Candidatus Omnitrophota bacterium]
MDRKDLRLMACQIRRDILKTACKAKSAHIGSSLSIVDLLVVLYFDILHLKRKDPFWSGRDRFILSKGHGCLALYVILTKLGLVSKGDLELFCANGGCLGGHPEFNKDIGLEASTGSLGHGLSIGLGMALSFKKDKKNNRVFILMGDGECNEGSVWEAAMAASHFKTDNICSIIDYNKMQATGKTEEVMSLEPLREKWEAFGWVVEEIDGNNIKEISKVLEKLPFQKYRPSAVIAHTIKGKGVSFMENNLTWHYQPPSEEDLKRAFKELRV